MSLRIPATSGAALLFCSLMVSAQSPTKVRALTLDGLFPKDRLLEVKIELAKADWDTIRRQRRTFFSALRAERQFKPLEPPYTYVDAKVTIDGVTFAKVGIRKKGFIGSQSSTEPSLKIKLNHLDKQGSIDGLSNLTFNNNKQDESVVSQFLAYSFFTAAGLPAPRAAFAKVTVNGRDLGVYTHVESMRRQLFDRCFGSSKGTLYEGTVVDFYPGWEGSFERKFGSKKKGRAKIEELTRLLQRDPSTAGFEAAIGGLVDLDAFYRFWAVESLLGFWDGYSGNANNYFVYLHPKTAKFHFLPWGADALFMKYGVLRRDRRAPLSAKTWGLVAHKLYQVEDARQRYAAVLREVMAKHWNEKALLAEVDRLEKLLEPHLTRRHRRFEEALDRTREFIGSRGAELVAEMADGMPIWTAPPRKPFVMPDRSNRRSGTSSIWDAAMKGDVRALGRQLSGGADVDGKNENGDAPLGIAAVAGRGEAVTFLLSKGASVSATNKDGSTPLHGAAFLGHVEVVKLLLQGGADPGAPNQKGESSLDVAAAAWNDQIAGFVEFLAGILRIKLDPEAVQAGRQQVAAILREHAKKRDKKD